MALSSHYRQPRTYAAMPHLKSQSVSSKFGNYIFVHNLVEMSGYSADSWDKQLDKVHQYKLED